VGLRGLEGKVAVVTGAGSGIGAGTARRLSEEGASLAVVDDPDRPDGRAQLSAPGRTFVIVHGAWGGGWEWTPVARELRRLGHEVFTPTLTGMGERAHLGGPAVTMATHVEDVVSVLELEQLDGVVLCGASYGGMPVTGAADRVPERIGLVVYVDALVPRDGQSALDLLPAAFGETARAEAGDGWRVPFPPRLLPPAGWVSDGELARYAARLRDQPLRTFTEPVRLSGAVDRLPRAFVRCTEGDLAGAAGADPIEPMALRARAEGWPYRELAAPHDPQLADPAGTASVLHELAAAAP
jgi:pimeloyl-ACP methyl ester carboxylesterase